MASAAKERNTEKQLNATELRFALQMLLQPDQTKAARAAGLKNPQTAASRMMKKPHVAAFVAELRKKSIEKFKEMAPEKVVEKIELSIDLVFKTLHDVMQFGGGHYIRGERDRIEAAELAIKYLKGFFDKGAAPQGVPTLNQQFNLGGPTPGGVSQTALPVLARMYLPKWRREQLGIDSPNSAAADARCGAAGGDGERAPVLGTKDTPSS